MNKNLVNSELEYMELFYNFDSDYQKIEKILNIEFAFEDGSFSSDYNTVNENQNIDIYKYRKNEDSTFPAKYPCVVVHCFETDYDRYGKMEFEFLDFVYLGDFKI